MIPKHSQYDFNGYDNICRKLYARGPGNKNSSCVVRNVNIIENGEKAKKNGHFYQQFVPR